MASIELVNQRSVLPQGEIPYIRPPGEGYKYDSFQRAGAELQQGAAQLQAELDKMQNEDNDREFGKLDNEMSDYIRLKSYGDGTAENPGYLNSTGENAMNGYSLLQKDIDKKVADLKKTASNQDVLDRFTVVSDHRTNDAYSSFLNHAGDQRKVANDQTTEARIAAATSDAVSNFGNPMFLEQGLAVQESELRSAGARNGSSPEAIEFAVKQQKSKTIAATVTAAIVGNLGYAKQLTAKYSGEIDGLTLADLKDKMHAEQRQQLSDYFQFDRLAKDRLEDKQKAQHREVAGKLNDYSETQIIDMFSKNQLSEGGKDDLLAMKNNLAQPGAGNARAQTLVELGLRTRQISPDDVFSMVADPAKSQGMNEKQLQDLMEKATTFANNDPILSRQDVKDGMEQINRVMSVPQTLAEGFLKDQLRTKWNNSARFFTDTITAHPEMSGDQVAQMTLERFRMKPHNLQEYPKPYGWPQNISWGTMDTKAIQKGMAASMKSLLDDLNSKKITPETFNQEKEAIEFYTEQLKQMTNAPMPTQSK